MPGSFTELVGAMSHHTEVAAVPPDRSNAAADAGWDTPASVVDFDWQARCVSWHANPNAHISGTLGRADIEVFGRMIVQGILVHQAPSRLISIMPRQHQPRQLDRKPPQAVWFLDRADYYSFNAATLTAIRIAFPDALPDDNHHFNHATATVAAHID